MKGQFFVVATVIMIVTLMSLVRYFYSFSDIDLPKVKELSELEYIPYIKQVLNDTVFSFNGDCDKFGADLSATDAFLENSLLNRGMLLNISYVFSCPPSVNSPIQFNFTIKTSGLYTETVFNSP